MKISRNLAGISRNCRHFPEISIVCTIFSKFARTFANFSQNMFDNTYYFYFHPDPYLAPSLGSSRSTPVLMTTGSFSALAMYSADLAAQVLANLGESGDGVTGEFNSNTGDTTSPTGSPLAHASGWSVQHLQPRQRAKRPQSAPLARTPAKQPLRPSSLANYIRTRNSIKLVQIVD